MTHVPSSTLIIPTGCPLFKIYSNPLSLLARQGWEYGQGKPGVYLIRYRRVAPISPPPPAGKSLYTAESAQ